MRSQGAVAGIVMAAAMMGYMLVRQQSVWTNPNPIAVMWMGPKAATGGFGIAAHRPGGARARLGWTFLALVGRSGRRS